MKSSLAVYFARWRRAAGIVWRADRVTTSLGLLLTVLSAILPMAMAVVGKQIVDAVIARATEEAVRRILIELALAAGQAVCARALLVVRTVLGARLSLEFGSEILHKAASLELAQVESPHVQDLLSRAERESDSRPLLMVGDAAQLLQNFLTLVGYATLLFAYTPAAVVVLLLSSIPAAMAEIRYSNQIFQTRNRLSRERRHLSYVEHVVLDRMYAKEFRVYDLAELFLGRYLSLGHALYREERTLALKKGGWASLLSFLALGAFYGFYLHIGRQAAMGAITLGQLTLYVVALRQGQLAFQTALSSLNSMHEHQLYLTNLFEYLSIPVTRKVALSLPRVDHSGFVFENVSFRYPGQETWALREISLRIPPGESLAIVGFNGAGKTTLIHLLCRLYDPTEGRILLDGVDLRDWPTEARYRRVSVVFQDFNRYQLTLGENVALGDVTHLGEEPRILEAIERGGAREIFEQLPAGLSTQLGRVFDGAELSGGQWQKIATARVFMKAQTDILILDEPTAALDPEAEYRTLQTFRRLTDGKTSILISHHFPVARLARRIVVLEKGRLIEDGSHEDLLAAQGRYAYLFGLQAEGYA